MSHQESSILFSRLDQEIASPIIVDLMARALSNLNLLSLAAGFTDNMTLPRELVRLHATELTQEGFAKEPLQYGHNQGRQRLREAIEWRLARR